MPCLGVQQAAAVDGPAAWWMLPVPQLLQRQLRPGATAWTEVQGGAAYLQPLLPPLPDP